MEAHSLSRHLFQLIGELLTLDQRQRGIRGGETCNNKPGLISEVPESS